MTTQNGSNTFRSWLCRAALGGADRLAAYQEGALPAATSARVERHLAACSACREELATLREVSALLLARRPAAPPPAGDLWQRIRAEIEAAPAPLPVRSRRRSFLAPTLGAAAMAAMAAVALFTASHPGAEETLRRAPETGSGGPPVAFVSPGVIAETPTFGADALVFGVTTGLHGAQIAFGSPAKQAWSQGNVSSLRPKRRIVAMRSPRARSNFPAVADPFLPLWNRGGRSGFMAKARRGVRGRMTLLAAAPSLPAKQESRPAGVNHRPATASPPPAETGSSAVTAMTSLAPGGKRPGVMPASSSSVAVASIAAASADDPSGPSPTLTAARGVAASDSAVTRYLSDNRRSGLFRYASSQVLSSSPSQPELLR